MQAAKLTDATENITSYANVRGKHIKKIPGTFPGEISAEVIRKSVCEILMNMKWFHSLHPKQWEIRAFANNDFWLSKTPEPEESGILLYYSQHRKIVCTCVKVKHSKARGGTFHLAPSVLSIWLKEIIFLFLPLLLEKSVLSIWPHQFWELGLTEVYTFFCGRLYVLTLQIGSTITCIIFILIAITLHALHVKGVKD